MGFTWVTDIIAGLNKHSDLIPESAWYVFLKNFVKSTPIYESLGMSLTRSTCCKEFTFFSFSFAKEM